MTTDEMPRHRWVGMLVLAVYVVTGFFPYLVSGLVVPLWGLAVMMLSWGLGLALTARLALRRPMWSVLAIPAVLGFWVLYVNLGSALFGWTA